MSACRKTPLTGRRRVVVVAASTACIAASLPLVLRHSGPSDWTDLAFGMFVGVGLGLAAVTLVATLLRRGNA